MLISETVPRRPYRRKDTIYNPVQQRGHPGHSKQDQEQIEKEGIWRSRDEEEARARHELLKNSQGRDLLHPSLKTGSTLDSESKYVYIRLAFSAGGSWIS